MFQTDASENAICDVCGESGYTVYCNCFLDKEGNQVYVCRNGDVGDSCHALAKSYGWTPDPRYMQLLAH